jgi:hypothetical protein
MPEQLDLFEDALVELNGRTFGELMEQVPDPDAACPAFPDFECTWKPSCARDSCWRAECAATGRPLFGIGPRSLA